MRYEQLYINGNWVSAASGKTFETINPANGQVIARIADGGRDDTATAINAANQAFQQWSTTTSIERADILWNVYNHMNENLNFLAEVLTVEQGKPLIEARNELIYAASFFRWYAEEARRIYGQTIPGPTRDKRLVVLKQPVGVVAAITPWNFPQGMIARKIAPALAAGCTVVVKPAKQTPLNAIELFKVLDKAGFPNGVINLITTSTSAEVGKEIMERFEVRKVTFTGSTEVGKLLIRDSAATVKKVSMELGGHAPFIIFADADLDEAVDGLIANKYRNAGQTCVCANRIYVEKSIEQQFIKKFVDKVKGFHVGDGMDATTVIGPLIDQAAIEKCNEHIRDAVTKGAEIVIGGKAVNRDGTFFEPTILSNVTDHMKISYEETFGPIAPIMTFESEDEVIRRANNVPFGLASYFYTSDINRSIRVSERLEYGIVGINDALPAVAQAPFGGVKESGLGREGGREGIEDFLDIKYISIKVSI